MSNFNYYLVSFVVGLLLYSVTSVPEGMAYIVERLGRYSRTLHPGINFIVPILERVGHKMNVQEQVLDIPPQVVTSKDNTSFSVDSSITYRIIDASKAAYRASDPGQAILKQAETDIRTVAAAMDANELLNRQNMFSARLLAVMSDATTPWGVQIVHIVINSATTSAAR